MRLEAMTVKRTVVFFTRYLPDLFGVPPLRCSGGLLRFAEVVIDVRPARDPAVCIRRIGFDRVRAREWRLPVSVLGVACRP